MPGAGDPVAEQLRAGGRALLVLADPASVSILRHLVGGPLESAELLDRVDYVSRSTYFERMRDLEDLSLITRRRRADIPPVAECRLAGAGQRLLPVADLLEAWLAGAPGGRLKLGEAYATATVKALAVAWGSTLLRWLGERPRTLPELERLVEAFGYRKLERIVRDLVKAGFAERGRAKGRLSTYGVTDWARQAAGLLAAAMRWERREIARESAAVTEIEAEGVLLLGLPLIDLPDADSGTCALLVDSDAPEGGILGGAVVRVMDGRPVAWGPAAELEDVEIEADCWMRGTTGAWLGTNAPGATFRAGGDINLAEKVMTALRKLGSLRPRVLSGAQAESAGPS